MKGMTFVSRMLNVVNPKFVAVNTCNESTKCHPRSKRTLSLPYLLQREVRSRKIAESFTSIPWPSSEVEFNRTRGAGARISLGMEF